jgi:hypothetical protein
MIVLSFLKLFQDLRHYVSLKRWLFTFNLISLICRYGSLIIDPFGHMLYLNLNPVVLHVFLRVVRRSAGIFCSQSWSRKFQRTFGNGKIKLNDLKLL